MIKSILHDPPLNFSNQQDFGSGIHQVARRSALSYDEFARNYLWLRRPVILSDAIEAWPANGKWTPNFFKTRYATKEVTIDGRTYQVGNLIDLINASTSENPAPYLRAQKLVELFPDLASDIEPTPHYSLPNWLTSHYLPNQVRRSAMAEVLIGGKGASFHVLHWDKNHLHAFVSQLYGQKEFFIYSPEQTAYLYPKADAPNQSQVDIHKPDYDRFPLFKQADPIRVMVEPGETIFVPSGWWHTTLMPGPSISITWNLGNGSNWADFTKDNQYRLDKYKIPLLASAFGLYSSGFSRFKSLKDKA